MWNVSMLLYKILLNLGYIGLILGLTVPFKTIVTSSNIQRRAALCALAIISAVSFYGSHEYAYRIGEDERSGLNTKQKRIKVLLLMFVGKMAAGTAGILWYLECRQLSRNVLNQ